MQQILNTWMPRIRRVRGRLTLVMLLLFGVSWYLRWPSALIATWQEDDEVRYVTMCGSHTLVVGKLRAVTLYSEVTNQTHQTLSYQGILDHQIAAVSSDGNWLVAATLVHGATTSWGGNGAIEVWSLNPAQAVESHPVPLLAVNQSFDGIAIRHDGQQVGWITQVDRSLHYVVTIWDRAAKIDNLVQYHGDRSEGVWLDRLFFEGTEPLGIYVNNTHVEVRQLHNGVPRYQIVTSESPDTISQDEKLIAYSGIGQVSIRRLRDGQLLWHLPTRHYSLLSLDTAWTPHTVFSADSQFLVIAASVNRQSGGLSIGIPSFSRATNEPAQLWDLRTGQVVQRFEVQPDGATLLAYSPDGQYVAAARGNEVRVFRVSPQIPFVQPACMWAGLLLAVLLGVQWVWARRVPKDEG